MLAHVAAQCIQPQSQYKRGREPLMLSKRLHSCHTDEGTQRLRECAGGDPQQAQVAQSHGLPKHWGALAWHTLGYW